MSETKTGLESELKLRNLLNVIKKYRWTISFFCLLCISLAVFYSKTATKIYEARSSIILDIQPPQTLSQIKEVYSLGAGSYWLNKEYFETQYKVITSRSIIERVVRKLNLDQQPDFVKVQKREPEENLAQTRLSMAIRQVQSRLSIFPVKDSRVVQVAYRDPDKKRSARLVNTLVGEYIHYNLELKTKFTLRATLDLSKEVDRLKKNLEKSEEALNDFKKTNDMLSTSLKDSKNITLNRLISLYKRLSEADANLDLMSAWMNQIRTLKKGEELSLDRVISNMLIQKLSESSVKTHTDIIDLKTKYLEKHPSLISNKAQLDHINVALQNYTRLIIESIKKEYDRANNVYGSLMKKIDQVKEKAFDLNSKELTYNRLFRESQKNEWLFNLVKNRYEETKLDLKFQTNNIYLLDPAETPDYPVRPNLLLNLILGILLGLLGGISLAFLLEFLDNTIKSEEDIRNIIKLPVLGIIPLFQDFFSKKELAQLKELIALHSPKTTIAENLRSININIRLAVGEKDLKSILISSAGPHEGKTTAAANIAITAAQTGKKVILVDADLRKPRLHKIFQLKNDQGLSSIVLSEDFSGLIQPTEIPNLKMIPSGPIPPNSIEILGSQRMKDFLTYLKEHFDLIILDSPPIVMVADSIILSRLVDGTVLVVSGNETLKIQLLNGKIQLENANAKILGCILNRISIKSLRYGFNYYYNYYKYYSHYYSKDPKAARKS